jgi:hypothetical protein
LEHWNLWGLVGLREHLCPQTKICTIQFAQVPSEGHACRRHLPALLGHFEPFSSWVLDSHREVIRTLEHWNLWGLVGLREHLCPQTKICTIQFAQTDDFTGPAMRFVPSEGHACRRHLPALLGHFEPFSSWVLDSHIPAIEKKSIYRRILRCIDIVPSEAYR